MESLKKAVFIVTVSLFIGGCASTRQYVPLPDQSKTIENPDKARIYVMRPTVFGAAISMSVQDGDKAIGKTGPNGYLSWERDPGQALISSKAENTYSLDVDVEKGMTYYILQHVRTGFWIARTKLELLSLSKGLEALKNCKAPTVVPEPAK